MTNAMNTDEMMATIDRGIAEIERLRGLIAWVGEVYPGTGDAECAVVEMTWEHFNAMREAIGRKPLKPVRRKAR